MSGVQIRILVIDDNYLIVSLLERYLSEKGYDTVATTSSENALSLVSSESFDIVITDLKMKTVSGIDILKRLDESAFRGKTIIISANPGEFEEELKSFSVDAIVEKPFELSVLNSKISSLLPRTLKRGSSGLLSA